MFYRLLLIVARRLLKHWAKHVSAEAKREVKTGKLLERLVDITAMARLGVISETVMAETRGKVQEGGFKGMTIHPGTSWDRSGLVPKLLGCYEEEIVEWFTGTQPGQFERIINIGCAEGFYAVGLARTLAANQIIAVDLDPAALEMTRRNAEANGVGERVETRQGIDEASLQLLLKEVPNTLVVSDCEGFELELFSSETIVAAQQATCLIESHDFSGKGVTDILESRFAGSHHVKVIEEGQRNPNRYRILQGMNELDRWLAVCEFRPLPMRWIAAMPKRSTAT